MSYFKLTSAEGSHLSLHDGHTLASVIVFVHNVQTLPLKQFGQVTSNIASETVWPSNMVKQNFTWSMRGTKVCINGAGHMTKMSTMPIYGKNPSGTFFNETWYVAFGTGTSWSVYIMTFG